MISPFLNRHAAYQASFGFSETDDTGKNLNHLLDVAPAPRDGCGPNAPVTRKGAFARI